MKGGMLRTIKNPKIAVLAFKFKGEKNFMINALDSMSASYGRCLLLKVGEID